MRVFFASYLFTLCPFTTGMHAQNSLNFNVFSLNVRRITDQTKKRSEYLFVFQRSESETLFSTRNIHGTGE